MTSPDLSLDDAQKLVATKTAPKVTQDSIIDKIYSVEYLFPSTAPHLTICVILMKNGFAAIGKAAPASVENFDAEVGKRYAYEDAFRSLWPLEGYLLCEKLTNS